jgi:hypothetical protein
MKIMTAPRQRHHQPGISGRHSVLSSNPTARDIRGTQPCSRAARCQARARHMPVSRVTHGDSRSLTEQPPLPLTRAAAGPPRAAASFASRGSQRRETARRWTQIAGSKPISRTYLRILGSLRGTRRRGAPPPVELAGGMPGHLLARERHERDGPGGRGCPGFMRPVADAITRWSWYAPRACARWSRPRPTRQCRGGCVAWMGKSGRADIAARCANCCQKCCHDRGQLLTKTTGLEHRPRGQPLLDRPGRSAHNYGSVRGYHELLTSLAA